MKYGVSISRLKDWNNKRNTKIYIGERLKIYGEDYAQSLPSSSDKLSNYRVQKGDSLYSISRRFAVPLRALADANGRIKAGNVELEEIELPHKARIRSPFDSNPSLFGNPHFPEMAGLDAL